MGWALGNGVNRAGQGKVPGAVAAPGAFIGSGREVPLCCSGVLAGLEFCFEFSNPGLFDYGG